MINFKYRGPRSNCLTGLKKISRARIRKLPVHDQDTRGQNIGMVIGHKEISNLYFILKIIFSLHVYRKKCIFSNLRS